MTITIKIRTGNAAMQSVSDIKQAIMDSSIKLTKGEEGFIRDINGNTVGKWQVG